MDGAFFDSLCDQAFGANGSVSKAYAAKEGDALFASFMAELSKVPDSNAYKATIIKNAKAKRYHDFEGDLMKIGLVADLYTANLQSLAERVKMGDFDF
jgi:hypothetical protein